MNKKDEAFKLKREFFSYYQNKIGVINADYVKISIAILGISSLIVGIIAALFFGVENFISDKTPFSSTFSLFLAYSIFPLIITFGFYVVVLISRKHAIIKGYLGNLEKELNADVGEDVLLLNSQLTDAFFTKRFITNKLSFLFIAPVPLLINVVCFLRLNALSTNKLLSFLWKIELGYCIITSIILLFNFAKNNSIRKEIIK